MTRKIWIGLIAWGVLSLGSVLGQSSPLGIWKTIDDKTGEAKSHVEVYEKNGQIYGKITKILTDRADAKCDKCKDYRRNQPVMGMVIMDGLKPRSGAWGDGNILDPESGNVYGCTIWLAEGTDQELKVRGRHWTGIFRTQTWYRVK